MACINCGNEVAGNFCSNCGQSTRVKRVTLKESWLDFWSRIYGFDGMFPRTLKDLTIRPAKVVQLFNNGNRVQYYGPVGYFFLMITLYLLIMDMFDVNVADFMSENQRMFAPQPRPGTGQEKFNKMVLDTVADNLKLIAFIIIPFNAFVARFIFFRKMQFNFIEHCILPLYIIGHGYWFSIVAVIAYKLNGTLLIHNLLFGVLMAYFGYGYAQLNPSQAKWKGFLKGVGVYIGGQLLLIVAALIVVSGVIAILNIVSPESLELIRPSNNF